MMAALPVDLLHLLSEQLAIEQQFSTLYNCIVSSKHFSNAGAVTALYRYFPFRYFPVQVDLQKFAESAMSLL